MAQSTKRTKISYKCPNPLFTQWLEEWKEEATAKNSNLQYCYGKALRSLNKYPVPLKSGRECLILENFGNGLCTRLDKKLEEYRKTHPDLNFDNAPKNVATSSVPISNNQQNASKPNNKRKQSKERNSPTTSPSSKKQCRPYVPVYRSGPYAILITLYKNQSKPSYPGFMTKAALQKSAEPLCDSSFYKPDPGSRYTAWSSMSTLIKKALVSKTGQPARYSLTVEGSTLAKQLEEADSSDYQSSSAAVCQNQSPSSPLSYRASPRKPRNSRKSPKKYSAVTNTFLSDEEDDPDDPASFDNPKVSSKPYSSSDFSSRKTRNARKLPKKYSAVTNTFLSDEEDDPDDPASFDFPEAPPRTYSPSDFFSFSQAKGSSKGSSASSPCNLLQPGSDTENVDCLTWNSHNNAGKKDRNESSKRGAFSSNVSSKLSSVEAEPIILDDTPEKPVKYSRRTGRNPPSTSSSTRKATASTFSDFSDSDGDAKATNVAEKQSLKCKKKTNMDSKLQQSRQSRARTSHDLSDIEDDPPASNCRPKNSGVNYKFAAHRDDSAISFSLSDDSEIDITEKLPSKRLAFARRSLSEEREKLSSFAVKSPQKRSLSPKNSVSHNRSKKLPEKSIPNVSSTVGISKGADISKKKDAMELPPPILIDDDDDDDDDKKSSPKNTSGALSDLYFGNEEDDYLLSQVNFDSPRSPKGRDDNFGIQSKPTILSSSPYSGASTSKTNKDLKDFDFELDRTISPPASSSFKSSTSKIKNIDLDFDHQRSPDQWSPSSSPLKSSVRPENELNFKSKTNKAIKDFDFELDRTISPSHSPAASSPFKPPTSKINNIDLDFDHQRSPDQWSPSSSPLKSSARPENELNFKSKTNKDIKDFDFELDRIISPSHSPPASSPFKPPTSKINNIDLDFDQRRSPDQWSPSSSPLKSTTHTGNDLNFEFDQPFSPSQSSLSLSPCKSSKNKENNVDLKFDQPLSPSQLSLASSVFKSPKRKEEIIDLEPDRPLSSTQSSLYSSQFKSSKRKDINVNLEFDQPLSPSQSSLASSVFKSPKRKEEIIDLELDRPLSSTQSSLYSSQLKSSKRKEIIVNLEFDQPLSPSQSSLASSVFKSPERKEKIIDLEFDQPLSPSQSSLTSSVFRSPKHNTSRQRNNLDLDFKQLHSLDKSPVSSSSSKSSVCNENNFDFEFDPSPSQSMSSRSSSQSKSSVSKKNNFDYEQPISSSQASSTFKALKPKGGNFDLKSTQPSASSQSSLSSSIPKTSKCKDNNFDFEFDEPSASSQSSLPSTLFKSSKHEDNNFDFEFDEASASSQSSLPSTLFKSSKHKDNNFDFEFDEPSASSQSSLPSTLFKSSKHKDNNFDAQFKKPLSSSLSSLPSSLVKASDHDKNNFDLQIKEPLSSSQTSLSSLTSNSRRGKGNMDFQSEQSVTFSQSSNSSSSSKSSVKKASSQKSSSCSQSSSQAADMHIFMPDTFDIILLVDNAETNSRLQKPFLLALDNNETKYEVRHLKVGDYLWIARDKNSSAEVVLPYIVERKRMDDFACSIKDGRFHEQKLRLKQSGIEKLIYLVETYGGHYGLPETTVHQAAVNTYVVDNFQLKYTSDYKHSAAYLSTLTSLLSKQFKDKTIVSCEKSSLPDFDVHSDFVSLMTFKDFSKGMSKVRNYTVKEMFIKQLLQLYGMSVEKAVAITDKYPTPKSLVSAFKKGGRQDMLASITFGTTKRTIGPALSKNVFQLYTLENFP